MSPSIHVEARFAQDWRPWSPDSGRMVGGREALVLRLVAGLRDAGHAVFIRGAGWRGEHLGARFLPDDEVPPEADWLICVDRQRPNGPEYQRGVFWSHAAQLPATAGWHHVVAVSEYHAGLLRARLPSARVATIRGGVEPPTTRASTAPLDRLLYASSPDRGLHRLLAMWPTLWRRFGLPLAITYDLRSVLRRYRTEPGLLGDRLRHVSALIDQPGVIVHGDLSGARLAGLRARSAALLYPLDPVIPASELYALSVLEAVAAGVPALLSPVDCFPTVYGEAARFVNTFDAVAWSDALAEVLADRGEWAARGQALAARRTWAAFDDAWRTLLAGLDASHDVMLEQPVCPPADAAWRPPPLLP